jgi:hypothetical protein
VVTYIVVVTAVVMSGGRPGPAGWSGWWGGGRDGGGMGERDGGNQVRVWPNWGVVRGLGVGGRVDGKFCVRWAATACGKWTLGG